MNNSVNQDYCKRLSRYTPFEWHEIADLKNNKNLPRAHIFLCASARSGYSPLTFFSQAHADAMASSRLV